MKHVLIVALLLVAGCSAEAYEERNEQRILTLDDSSFEANPELMLSKCYELTGVSKELCFDKYMRAKNLLGQAVSDISCERIGRICSK